jgi:hypothetical protein
VRKAASNRRKADDEQQIRAVIKDQRKAERRSRRHAQ